MRSDGGLRRLPAAAAVRTLILTALSLGGCCHVETIDGGDDSLCAEPGDGMICPETVTRAGSVICCDFGRTITARPVIEAKGPVKSTIRYRTCSEAADAVESAFELPDPNYHEQASDLMDRIVLITATHESKSARKFRFLYVEPADGVDILRTGGMPVSSAAPSRHR